MKKPARAALATVALLLTAACGSDEPDPVLPETGPATFTATLNSPNGPEGGALINLIRGEVTNVQAAVGDLFTQERGDTVKVLVLLQEPGDITFTFTAADSTRPPVARVVQVTDGENVLRTPVNVYHVELAR